MIKITRQPVAKYPEKEIIEESLLDKDDSIGAYLDRSFCANSDLFFHQFSKGLQDLPDEVYKRQAEYYQSKKFSP